MKENNIKKVLLLGSGALKIVIGICNIVSLLNLVKRRHTHVNMPSRYQFLCVAIEERKKQSAYMRTVLIGIGENDDFMILKVFKLKILAYAGSEDRKSTRLNSSHPK